MLELSGEFGARGFRSRIAEALNCQNAYVSQILNSEANLSLEQGLLVAEYLHLDNDSKKYFLLLVQLERAGSQKLRFYLEGQIVRAREESLILRGRVRNHLELDSEAKSIYYGHWYHAAIHLLVTIPKFQTRLAIQDALRLDERVLSEAIEFLLHWGLIEASGESLLPGPALLHLSHDSADILRHHTNWRLMAIRDIENRTQGSIHYSTVSSLSHEDFENIRSLIVNTIETYVDKVKLSKEERLCSFVVDFFQLA